MRDIVFTRGSPPGYTHYGEPEPVYFRDVESALKPIHYVRQIALEVRKGVRTLIELKARFKEGYSAIPLIYNYKRGLYRRLEEMRRIILTIPEKRRRIVPAEKQDIAVVLGAINSITFAIQADEYKKINNVFEKLFNGLDSLEYHYTIKPYADVTDTVRSYEDLIIKTLKEASARGTRWLTMAQLKQMIANTYGYHDLMDSKIKININRLIKKGLLKKRKRRNTKFYEYSLAIEV